MNEAIAADQFSDIDSARAYVKMVSRLSLAEALVIAFPHGLRSFVVLSRRAAIENSIAFEEVA